MFLKKIIFQNRYVALETPSRPPPLYGKCHLKFPFWFFDSVPYHPSNPLGEGGAFEYSIGDGLQDGQQDEEQSGQLGGGEVVWKVCGKLVRAVLNRLCLAMKIKKISNLITTCSKLALLGSYTLWNARYSTDWNSGGYLKPWRATTSSIICTVFPHNHI